MKDQPLPQRTSHTYYRHSERTPQSGKHWIGLRCRRLLYLGLSELFGIVLWLVLIFLCIAGIQYVLCHSVDNALEMIEKALHAKESCTLKVWRLKMRNIYPYISFLPMTKAAINLAQVNEPLSADPESAQMSKPSKCHKSKQGTDSSKEATYHSNKL